MHGTFFQFRGNLFRNKHAINKMLTAVERIGNARRIDALAVFGAEIEPLHFRRRFFGIKRRDVRFLVVFEIFDQRNARISRGHRQNQRFLRLFQHFFRPIEKRREKIDGKIFFGTGSAAE